MKDALWGGGGYPPELVDGEVDQDLIPYEGVREGLAWEKGWVGTHRSWLGGRGVREAGQGLGGGCKGFGSGGVSGRGTGPRDGANFATCGIFVEEKWLFLKDALWGGGGVPFWPGGWGGFQEKGSGKGGQGWVGTHQSWLGGRAVQGGRGGVQGLRFRGGRW